LIFSFVVYDYNAKWPVFLTNWGLILCTVYFITILIISGISLFGKEDSFSNKEDSFSNKEIPMYTLEEGENTSPIKTNQNEGNLPKGIIFLWLWHEITYIIVSTLIILYWALVYDTKHFETGLLSYSYINDHGVLWILLLIDLSFNTIPIRILHVVYSILICVAYAVVTVVYNFAANETVYPVLDWKKKAGWSIAYMIGAVILVFIVQLVFYGLYRLKLKFKQRQEL